jgi:hypothetical protein
MLRCTKQVGNLPRYLVSPKKFQLRILARDSFIDFISSNQSDIADVLTWKGMTSTGTSIPGTVFSVSVEETLLPQDSPMDVGYDGENVNKYEKILISLMVPHLKDSFLTKWRASILNYFGNARAADCIYMGFDAEDLFWQDLCEDREMMCQKMGSKDAKETIAFGCSSKYQPENKKIEDLKATVFDSAEPVACRMAVSCATIDFAGPGRQVYQVTVSKVHDMKACGMKDILLACGLLQQGENGKLSITKRKVDRLKFYWVVPIEIEDSWISKNPEKIKITGNEKLTPANFKTVKECCLTFVDHYVLSMKP